MVSSFCLLGHSLVQVLAFSVEVSNGFIKFLGFAKPFDVFSCCVFGPWVQSSFWTTFLVTPFVFGPQSGSVLFVCFISTLYDDLTVRD